MGCWADVVLFFADPAVLQRMEVPCISKEKGTRPFSPHFSPYIWAAVHSARCLGKWKFTTDRMTFKANILCIYRKLETTLTTQQRGDVLGNLELV